LRVPPQLARTLIRFNVLLPQNLDGFVSSVTRKAEKTTPPIGPFVWPCHNLASLNFTLHRRKGKNVSPETEPRSNHPPKHPPEFKKISIIFAKAWVFLQELDECPPLRKNLLLKGAQLRVPNAM